MSRAFDGLSVCPRAHEESKGVCAQKSPRTLTQMSTTVKLITIHETRGYREGTWVFLHAFNITHGAEVWRLARAHAL